MERPGTRYIKFLLYSNLIIWSTWIIATGVLALQLVWPVVPDNIREVAFYVSLPSGVTGAWALVTLLFAGYDVARYEIFAWWCKFKNS